MTHSHRAERADRASVAIPRPRTAGQAEGALKVHERRRYGRRWLHVSTADGRPVGWLSLNSGVIKLTNERERPQFQAAVVQWFAEGLSIGEIRGSPSPMLAAHSPAHHGGGHGRRRARARATR